MHEVFDGALSARLTLDDANRVRSINHDVYWESGEASARDTALRYLRAVADTFDVPQSQLLHAHQAVNYLEPEARDTEYRLAEEKTLLDATTEGFYQTYLNVPVWASGVSVTVKSNPMRVVAAANTSLDKVEAEMPSEEAISRYRELFRSAAQDQPPAGFADEQPRGTESGAYVADLVGGKATGRRGRTADAPEAEARRAARLLSGRFFIYRFDPAERVAKPEGVPDQPAREDLPDLAGGSILGTEPTLPLPPVDDRIRAGQDYLVAELVMFYPTVQWGDVNWRLLVEVETGSILYLRSLAAHVNGLVFNADPISESGNAANLPSSTSAVLNTFRDDVALLNLDAPSGGTQALKGSRARVAEVEAPTVAAPTQPAGNDFDYDARTNNFAAVNAYYHVDRFFNLVENLGFPLATYFDGTVFPVRVDHRGLGTAINAHCVGTATGIDHLCYALADTTDTTNPIGIAADWRVHLHELGGHGILEDHVGGPNFGFSHSAGDSLAVILSDPDSIAPDRFVLAPFVPVVARRHDRTPAAGWGWGGVNDVGGYSSEQILSTTLFRVYRSLGGDSADVNRRRFAARYMTYLVLRTVGTLTPATNPPNALAFANAMIATDPLNWTSEGVFGGAYGKVIRWSFEKQGLFQAPGAPTPVTTAGQPPLVDVYIDDGRAGEYQFQPVHWHTTTIWNRLAADGLPTHQEPALGATNFIYVKIKNRGTQQAQNIVVYGYHTKPMAGLLWPNDFTAFATASINVGTLNANNSEEKIVGPFQWVPNLNAYGHDCVLMIATATGDASNIDQFTAGEVIPEWRLVPNDNNIGQRNVYPVPGGGSLEGLMAGLHGFPFWVGNPNPGRAMIDIDVKLPPILAERGWRLSFEGLGSNRFPLASTKQRQLTIQLHPGAAFERSAVDQAADRDIVLTARADGSVIGGMTYRLDPEIVRSSSNASSSTAGPRRAFGCGRSPWTSASTTSAAEAPSPAGPAGHVGRPDLCPGIGVRRCERARRSGRRRVMTTVAHGSRDVPGQRPGAPIHAVRCPSHGLRSGRVGQQAARREGPMRTKAEQLAAIRADQRFWRQLAAEVGPDRYAEPGPMGEWSFGDLAGHLAGWRDRTIARLEATARGEPEPAPPWPADLEDDDGDGTFTINDWIHRQHAGRSPEQLIADYDASYDRLHAVLEALPDATLSDPSAFPWAEGPLLDADFTAHLHEEHVPGVRAWLSEG
jgi:hypothetical protein